ncbi:MAG: FliG C-terminal domain-containing protein, partial [Candidatus Latescibacteria bacterium]|nr:FliG C-terminal domain-containing protein [Candidatus Latescibacterota bacterium]
SDRVGGLIRDEMEFAGPRASEDVKAAQLGITEVVRKLKGTGQITWPQPAKRSAKRKLGKEYLAKKRETRALARRPLHELSLKEVNRLFVGLAEIARREGILALDSVMKGAGDRFMAAGIRLATDGTEPELIQAILGTWMESLLREQEVKYRKTLEGIMSIQSGDNPRIVEQKLGVLY